jgi:pimeloyl-ACP methyl ester carboxylesterase
MAIRRPEDFEHHTAPLRDVQLHFVREGRGPPLLLLHGWPGFWWEWRKNIADLARDFDVIAADMRGYGDSEKPDLSRIELFHTERVVDDLSELLDHLGIEQAFLVGHDYSAIVLHKFVRKYRERVSRALIINPITPGFDERYMSARHFAESWYAKFHQLDMAVALVASSRSACKAYYRHFLSHWSFDKTLFSDEELEIYTDNYMKPGNVQGGFNFYRAGQRGTWTNLDHTISDCPMTFLQGLDDPCIPSAWTDLVTNWYTNYRIEYVPEAGHFMMCEKPDIVNDRIKRAFLG